MCSYHKEHKAKYLVFSSVGDRNNIQSWTSGPGKKIFDVVIYYYGEEETPVFDVDTLVRRKGLKLENFHHFLSINDASQYEAIWVVDDDIIMDTESINTMFSIFKKYKLWLAQPSFNEDSQISWDITRKKPNNILRFTNFVECGVPIFSQKVIPQLKGTFKNAKTGAGLDLIWAKLLDFPKDKIAVIDTVSCHHPKNLPSSIDLVIPRQLHLVQGIKLLNEYGMLPLNSDKLKLNTWERVFDQLPQEARKLKEYGKIKKKHYNL
jgi:hypothetical protein